MPKHVRRGLTIALLAFFIACSLVAIRRGWRQVPQRTDGPHFWAAYAKSKGESTTFVRTFTDESHGMTLGEMAQCFSVVIAEARSATPVVDEDHLRTWYTFHIREVVSRPAKECWPEKKHRSARASITPQPGEVAVPVIGGRALIDGVEVTEFSGESPVFAVGKQYLLFFSFKSDSFAYVGLGGNGAYEILPEGNLHGTIRKSAQVKNRILAMRTLDRFRKELTVLSRP